MADLMSQHGFEFLVVKLFNQRVKQGDLSPLAQAGEKGIGMFGSSTAVHYLNSGVDETGALCQSIQPVFQLTVGQRGELLNSGRMKIGASTLMSN